MIGDAAHALPPNIGQGGGCAMMNALSLAVYLDREDDVAAALADLGAQRAADHRAHPAHLAFARLADHLAAGAARHDARHGRPLEMADAQRTRTRCTGPTGRAAHVRPHRWHAEEFKTAS